MPAGFGAYRRVLSDPAARAFSAAGVLARLPISMAGIGTVLLVSLTTGSFGRAGIVTAVGTLTGAAAAPLWGRLVDRVGQARVLIAAGLINGAGVSLLVTSVLSGWPLAVSLAAAVVVGLGATSAGACVRARWTYRLRGTPLLDTAFAVEAVMDEVVFIVGPVLVTFLATAIHPALGIGASALIGLVGALLLGAQRATEPPIGTAEVHAAGGALPVRVLVPVAVACLFLGTVFGGMEVVVVAFATEAGVLPYAGFLLMAWAAGSLVAGVVTGSIAWRASPQIRFRIGAVVLAATVVPLPFISQPWLLAGALALSGMAIAPTLIASVAVTQAAVPAGRLTEALAWTITGIASGVAAGAAVLGQLIDTSGARAGFWGVVVAGGALSLAVLWVRVRPGMPEPDSPEPVSPEPVSPEPRGIPAAGPQPRRGESPWPRASSD